MSPTRSLCAWTLGCLWWHCLLQSVGDETEPLEKGHWEWTSETHSSALLSSCSLSWSAVTVPALGWYQWLKETLLLIYFCVVLFPIFLLIYCFFLSTMKQTNNSNKETNIQSQFNNFIWGTVLILCTGSKMHHRNKNKCLENKNM